MDHEIPLKNPDEFFSTNMQIDLNNELCLNKEVNIFDWEILDNYAARILDAKYEQVSTNKVATNQKQLNINQRHKLEHLLAKNKKDLMDLLVCIPTKKSTLTYYQTQNRYTTMCTWFLKFTNKHSRRNSNTWLILEFSKNVEPQSGPCLASLFPKIWASQTNLWSLFSQQM